MILKMFNYQVGVVAFHVVCNHGYKKVVIILVDETVVPLKFCSLTFVLQILTFSFVITQLQVTLSTYRIQKCPAGVTMVATLDYGVAKHSVAMTTVSRTAVGDLFPLRQRIHTSIHTESRTNPMLFLIYMIEKFRHGIGTAVYDWFARFENGNRERAKTGRNVSVYSIFVCGFGC